VALSFVLGLLASTTAASRVVSPSGHADDLTAAPASLLDTRVDAWREPPYVAMAAPAGDQVQVNAAIVINFSQAMWRSTVERSFLIWPRVDGVLTWADDWTLRFQPVRFLHIVTYEVHVAGRSTRGRHLVGEVSWQFTTVAGPPAVLAPGLRAINVPILMYHYIRINPDPQDQMGFRLSVTPANFAAQMDWLAAHGYHPITFRDLDGYLAGAVGLPSRPVILTFDYGYTDFYTAAVPVLIGHDFKAVAYVVSGFMGRPGYMTAAQVQAADRAGIEIGSHTVNHVDLTKQSPSNLRFQLVASRQALEQLLGHPVLSFCYPRGRFNADVVGAVQAAGYEDATSTQFGQPRTVAGRFAWGRLRVSGGEDLGWFAADVTRTTQS
jgi:peptidoglycan/xylan/chitin deacetylase (PgdA/CDA1 family)